MNRLTERLSGNIYQGYAYGYPHKTAYRPLEPSQSLVDYWRDEDQSNLFFYLHIPFCEMRCGFCNLFTTTHPSENLVTQYLDAVERQMQQVSGILDDPQFSQVAFGGGTPSFLSCGELEGLFSRIDKSFGGFKKDIPMSFETSPATVNPEKLSLLKELGVTRLSIGVQSFIETETKSLGRPQKKEILLSALDYICDAQFPISNIDLIYGVEGQTVSSWLTSLKIAVSFSPMELYLYPLYVRPLTGLGKREKEPTDLRPKLYEEARQYLLSEGYEQISMRLFRHCSAPVPSDQGAIHCCQEDGMIGFGAGARSYTKNLHYSSEYAVGRKGVMEILQSFVATPASDFLTANYGCLLTEDDRRRRYFIKSILRREGFSYQDFQQEFAVSGQQYFKEEIEELVSHGLVENFEQKLILKPHAFQYSDTIGPWLISNDIHQRMNAYELT